MGAASRLAPDCCSNHARCPRLPIQSRSAIQTNGIAVFARNSRANATFLASPLRRARIRLAPAQPFEPRHHQPLGLRRFRLLHRLPIVPPILTAGIAPQQPLHPATRLGWGVSMSR